MSKPISIAFSDLHIHKFKQFSDTVKGINGRLYQSLQVLKFMGKRAHELDVPILFSGDLFHNNEEIENQTGSLTLKYYKKYIADKGIHFAAISGNHDFSERNGKDHRSPSHLSKLQVFPNFHLLDELSHVVLNNNLMIQGVPYMDNDADTLKEIWDRRPSVDMYGGNITKVLLLHQDFPGAKTPAGFECKEYNAFGDSKLKALFKNNWDWVLCGHIHKPQRLFNNTWMLGSPIHQISSDEGTEMGYWLIYRDRKPKFISLNDKFPTFKTIKYNQSPSNDKDYFIRLPKDDLAEKKVKKDKFSLNQNRERLAKNYVAHKGIKDKKKLKALKKILSEV